MQKYKIRYTFKCETEKEGYSPSDVNNENEGLCDSIVLVSIVLPEDGGYAQLLLSLNGADGLELSQNDLFKVWSMLGMQLHNNGALKNWKKQLVDLMAKMVRDIVVSGVH